MMNEPRERQFGYFFWCTAALAYILVLIRSWNIPMSHDEVATFYFYIQPGDFWPFYAHPDANGHFFTNILAWCSYKCFGDAPFVLRLQGALAYLVLAFAVYRFSHLFGSLPIRIFFAAGFLLNYSVLAYFSLCRGYAPALAFSVLALYYLLRYRDTARHNDFFKFVIAGQLALCANLTVLFFLIVCTGFFFLMQVRRRIRIRPGLVLTYALHTAMLGYWVAYAFYLKKHGALYYGEGESYWQVTFVSLVENLFGEKDWLPYAFLVMLVFMIYGLFRRIARRGEIEVTSAVSMCLLIFTTLVASFYLLKKFLEVNYPEDRTGLFFYPVFLAALCFVLDALPVTWRSTGLVGVFLLFANSAVRFDLSAHPWPIYETIPASFYEAMKAEQAQSKRKLTIAGHRVTEFIYGFQNFRAKGALNHCTAPEALQLNCDLAIARAADKPWYHSIYEDLASDERWGFRLIKRTIPLRRIETNRHDSVIEASGEWEYLNALDLGPRTLEKSNPLQANVWFRIENGPVPFQSFLVLQVDAEDPADNIFTRVPLDLVRHDWNKAEGNELNIVTGRMPARIKRLVVYFWNIEKKPVHLLIDSCSLQRLEGPGVNLVSEAKI